MGIWTSVTIEATTRADKHISIRKCVEDIGYGHDIVFEKIDSSDVSKALVKHFVEFRVELDGDIAINFLQKLNKWLRAVCHSHTMEIYGLLMY
jgi:hypothetical protein